MESQRSIERKYKKLLHDVATKDFYKTDLTNRVNCYTCRECGHVTKTRDVDAGVTPFMHNCESCSEMAYSTMYTDIAPNQEPTQEWYRPSLQECLKYRKKEYGEAMLDHILRGGLEVRKIEVPKQKTGIELIAEERGKQITKHGFTGEHHAGRPEWYADNQLIEAARYLSTPHVSKNTWYPFNWDSNWFYDLCCRSHEERLVIAGALLAAELDRLNFKP